MRKSTAISLTVGAIVALGLFYVAWPVWTGYRIRQAVETGNTALLEDKVDFPSVRVSLRPVLRSEIERSLIGAQDRGGLGGLLAGQLKGDRVDRLLDAAIATVVTPEAVIRTVREGRSVKELAERILKGQAGGGNGGPDAGGRGAGGIIGGVLGKLGGRGKAGDPPAGQQPPSPEAKEAPPAQPAQEATAPRRRLTLRNIKSFGIDGPLAFSFGIARDAEKAEPDIVVKLAFTGFDWRVVGVLPQINR